jgi:parallel beta-helix repeat protein
MNFHFSTIVAALVMASMPVRAASYYVDPVNGSDANSGASPTAAFRTLQKAANSTHPGDTVYAMAGAYTDTVDSQVISIGISGTATAPITFTNYNGEKANVQLSDNNWSGISIAAGTQYIVINGFEVTGINQSLTWAGANAARVSGLGNPMYNGAGISCSGAYNATTKTVTPVAHVVVENCIVHDCAEEGIASEHSDYLTIQDNTISNCSLYSSYEGSGISTWEDAAVDSNSSTYKMIINANTVYSCRA